MLACGGSLMKSVEAYFITPLRGFVPTEGGKNWDCNNGTLFLTFVFLFRYKCCVDMRIDGFVINQREYFKGL
jgi:hypothetical protein